MTAASSTKGGGGKRFAALTVSRIGAAAAQAVQLLLLARETTPTLFGMTSAAFGIATVVATAGDLGTGIFALRERSVDRRSGRVRAAVRLGACSTFTAGIVGFLASLVVLDVTTAMHVAPFWLWAVAERGTETWCNTAIADGRVGWSSASTLGRRLLSVPLFIGLLWNEVPPVFAFSISLATTAVLWWIIVFVKLSPTLPPTVNGDRISSIVASSFPFWVASLSGQLRNADVATVGLFAGGTTAGLYAVGARFGAPVLLVASSAANLLLPHFARTGMSGVRVRSRLLLPAGMCTMLILPVAVFAAPTIVSMLLGSSYQAAARPLQVLLPGLVLAGLSIALGSILQGLNDQKYVAMNGLFAAIGLLLAIALGAWAGGAVGAATAYTGMHSAKCILLIVRLWHLHSVAIKD